MMRRTINFDMDGTIANLYGVNNWLDKLHAEDPTPYVEAKPLLRLNTLARMLNRLQRQGYNLAIISWLSKSGSDDYMEAIRQAKKEWLRKHLPSVQWDRITIISYGTPKERYCETIDDILFDDERGNREAWTGKAFDVDNIIEILKGLSDE